MADFQQNAFNAINQGFNFGQQVKAVQDQKKINQLASQGYGAPQQDRQGLLGQMAQVDARSAQQQEQAFANTDERRNTTLANMARILTSAPDQARPGLYQQMLPTLSQFGMSELPQEYNAQTAPIINQAADSIASAYGGGGAGSTVQSQKVGEDGFIYNTFRDGRIVNTGVKADSRTQLRDQPGIAPSLVNLRTGQTSPLQAGPVQQQGANGAYTIDPSLPPAVQAQIRAAESAGVDYNGGNAGIVQARQDPSQIITPYQQAQLANQDRSNARADMAAEDARAARQAASETKQIAAQQKAREAQQNISTRQARLNDVRRGSARLDAALKAYDDAALSGLSGLPGSSALSMTPAGQELQAAAEGMKDSMLALTRVPGVGSQSDYEAKIAGMRYPQPGQYSDTNSNSMTQLRAFVNDLTGDAQRANEADRGSLQATTQVVDGPRGRTVTRRGRTPDGRVVIQYSDGAIEYGD